MNTFPTRSSRLWRARMRRWLVTRWKARLAGEQPIPTQRLLDFYPAERRAQRWEAVNVLP